jgi:hypothetical protein
MCDHEGIDKIQRNTERSLWLSVNSVSPWLKIKRSMVKLLIPCYKTNHTRRTRYKRKAQTSYMPCMVQKLDELNPYN